MASSTLRPLSVGEILDMGVNVVTRHSRHMVLALLAVTVPIWALVVMVIASIDPTAFQLVPEEEASGTESSGALIAALVISLLLLGLMSVVAFIALFKGVCDAWLGSQPSLMRSARFGLRRAPMVFVLWLIWIVPMAVFSICWIPALWLGTVWSLSIPAMLFERIGPIKALGRSWHLINGRFWASLLIVFVISTFSYLVSYAIFILVLIVAGWAAGDSNVANALALVIGISIASAVTYPYMAAELTILYFDQRVRKEGFDIQLLAAGLGDPDPDAPLPTPLEAPAGVAPYFAPRAAPPGWAPPSAEPLRWGPVAPSPPPDERPPSDSPWMTPVPEPPADAPGERAPADWPPPDEPRGPGGL